MTVSHFCTRTAGGERKQRPAHIRPPMKRENRAKQFAPFAALGSMQKLFSQTEAAMPTQDPERILLLSAEDIDDGYEE